jgi:hypothetical protein
MTTKQIAQAVNKTERSVQSWSKKIGEKIASIGEKIASVQKTGKPADYTLEETCAIIETGMGKNAASLFYENAKSQLLNTPSTESSLSVKDIALISQIVAATVAETIKQLDGRMGKIESRIEDRQALLPAPQIKPRDHITKLVREYATKNNQPYSNVWTYLYTEFGYRTNTNPRQCAKNRNMPIIEHIEAEGMIELLESVAIEIL